MNHAEKHQLLYPLQHGFMKGRSCETQLLEFTDDITRNMENGKQTDLYHGLRQGLRQGMPQPLNPQTGPQRHQRQDQPVDLIFPDRTIPNCSPGRGNLRYGICRVRRLTGLSPWPQSVSLRHQRHP